METIAGFSIQAGLLQLIWFHRPLGSALLAMVAAGNNAEAVPRTNYLPRQVEQRWLTTHHIIDQQQASNMSTSHRTVLLWARLGPLGKRFPMALL